VKRQFCPWMDVGPTPFPHTVFTKDVMPSPPFCTAARAGCALHSALAAPPCSSVLSRTTTASPSLVCAAIEPDKRIPPFVSGGGMEPLRVREAPHECASRRMPHVVSRPRNLITATHHHPHVVAHHLQVASRASDEAGIRASSSSYASATDLLFEPDPRDMEFSYTTMSSYSYAPCFRSAG
jgi:hypothetical protein